ncbi:fibronectin/fibrinogen-binding protein [Kurthia gibsonii]|uniref:Rqc2 family fibronectin-binding protein n=1 Tax=Kurthia TaxID=1649 RepID=UPI000745F081|nr:MULTISPECIES: NFACT RNA binding domain-containing protein [Kurthia]AMA62903.1 fibronectin-binding A family protein [Kurthia sp. 11kri321]RXH53439.1 fibronectin/fibrinogen-binding protein [Kurthia gibsonii]
MAYDGLFTIAMTKELQQLVTGRIAKVHQPNAQEVIFTIRANGANKKLLFSIHPTYARVHMTEQTIENPPEPPMFCSLLRKHVEGGFIETIEQLDADRILKLTISSKNEIGDPITRYIYAEIMGRHSNLIMVDAETEKIVDSLKHLPPAMNSYRTVLPGSIYIAPPKQDKWNPVTVTDDQLAEFFTEIRDAKEIMQQFVGFSPLHANELLFRAQEQQVPTVSIFRDFVNEFVVGGTKPTYLEQGRKVIFSPIDLHSFEEPKTYYNTLSELLDRVFFARAERDRVKQQAGDLENWLQAEINKLKLKLKKLDQDLKRAQNLDQYQLFGELLMANLYQFEKGAKSVTVENYYSETGDKITIPLSERKTPIENAQSYYAKYNKFKHALVKVEEQIQIATADIEYFELLAQQVQQASPADIEEIREELAEQGYMRLKKSKRRKKPVKPTPEKYVSSTGVPISIGKNNKQNDYLTFKIARKWETWLHTKDIPGSHVVIHSDDPDEQTILEAATLAAYFSKARESSSVPVDYTEVKQVKKPSGAKPGFVIYFEQKTVFVTPDEALVMQLQANT